MNKIKNKKLKILLNAGLITLSIFISNANIVYCNDNIEKATECENKKYKKIAYITIDDGPSKHTKTIIQILNKYNAKATFFMIDRNMKNYPEEVKLIIENGNSAGFHSVSHDVHQLYKNSTSAKEEFDKNKTTFYEITHQESDIVRLPYGSKPYTPTESYENLVEAGYKLWDWDLDTEDWKSNSIQIVENVKNNVKDKSEVIILIHEKQQTVEALDDMLKYLTTEGYEILPIKQKQQPQNFWIGNLYK